MSNGDLRLLIGQNIGLNVLVPRALGDVSHDPLAQTEYFPGDLLSALLRVQRTYWSDNSGELAQLMSIARSVANHGGPLADECRAFVAEEQNPSPERP
jgi:hypothetical protein